LVIEKDEVTVQRIVNGKILLESLIYLGISSTDERGMLGLAIPKVDSTSIIEKLLNVILFL
jgi:hypothetical protein